MKINTVGSVCSGIEAASVAWVPLGLEFKWFSEIAEFPSKILNQRYPHILNLGDMNNLPNLLKNESIATPDLICGGTPCQAFSLAGLKNGLNDDRGNLTLKFVEIVNANDDARQIRGQDPSVVFWENVEGVLTDKTNAFGSFVSLLAGFENELHNKKWPSAGVIHGPKRNIAWRVLDAKFFGLPQQRRRLYVLAGGKNFYPESILFEKSNGKDTPVFPKNKLRFTKDGHRFEIFREYTDCLYAAYGTKWNGNAAANNGSLFVVQNGRIRRLSPIECERLMGFPDNYTNLVGSKKTQRFQAVGNSWAVPVVRWIGQRLLNNSLDNFDLSVIADKSLHFSSPIPSYCEYMDLGKEKVYIHKTLTLNCASAPEECVFSNMRDVVCIDAPEDIYISPVGCYGIIRRKNERSLKINKRLEEVLLEISSDMCEKEIEKRSRVQKRGRYSDSVCPPTKDVQLTLFDLNTLTSK